MRTRLWRSRAAYLLAVDLILVLAGDAGCKHGQGGKPLDTAPGAPEYQALAWVGVPGARVNVAGGNLQVKRTDLSLDTRLGSLSIGATYNSHDGRWLWSFDVRYDGTTFVDASGAEHDLRQVDDGKAIPGTVWVKLDGTRLKTKGGFRHVFDASSGRLLRIRRASSAYPRLVYVQAPVAGVDRTVAIQQCTAATTCGDVFTVAYDAEGRVTQITDRAGRSADFAYDGEGRLTAARDGLDVERGWPGNRYEYGGDRLTSITNSEQERIEIDYQARRVVAVRPIGEENPVHRFRYFKQQAGLYSTVYTDPLGFEAAYRYDAERRIRTVDNALGERISLDWVGRRPVAMTLPDGVTTLWTYAGDNVATETDAAGNVLQFAYAPAAVNREDPFARPIATVSDTLGTVETRAYDSEGRLESIENGAGDTTSFFYDADEMLYRVINPANGQVVFTDYGDHGHPETATAQLSTSVSEYDPVGNLLKGTSLASETAPGWGGVVSRQFDADRNPSSILLVNQWSGGAGELQTGTVTIQYRSDGRRTSIERPNGGDTEFLYDSLGRMVERRDFATGVGHGAWQSTFFEYDAAARLTAIERPNGMREEFGYDAAGRRNVRTIVRDGQVESTAVLIFEDGRLASVVDSGHGGAETYSYDSAGRPALIQYPDGEWLWLGYDARSRQTVATFVADDLQVIRTLERGYDGADRETSLKEDGQLLLDREYEMGRLSRTTYGNGLEREVTYEDILTGFIDTIETRFVAGGAVVEATDVTIDSNCGLAVLCLSARTETFGTVSVLTDEYYEVGQLSGGVPEVADTGPRIFGYRTSGPETLYAFDPLSNLESIALPRCGGGAIGLLRTFGYNPERNRLLSVDDPECGVSLQYAYDEAGFVTDRNGVALEWDGAGRIRSVGSEAFFEWDTLGRPLSRTVLGAETRYRFGGRVEADAAGNPLAIEGEEVRIDLVTGEHLYRHHDFRGNVKFVTDDAGDVVRHVHYESYGAVQVHGEDDPFGFAQGRDVGGLLLLGHRLYEPDAGAFLAPDPIYRLFNQYAYTLGNPVWFWDPTGAAFDRSDATAGELHAQATQYRTSAVLVRIAAATIVALAAASKTWPGIGFAALLASYYHQLASDFEAQADELDAQADALEASTGNGGAQRAPNAQPNSFSASGTKAISGSWGIGPERWHGPPGGRGGCPGLDPGQGGPCGLGAELLLLIPIMRLRAIRRRRPLALSPWCSHREVA